MDTAAGRAMWSFTKARRSRICSRSFSQKGFSVEHYAAQDKPLFELVEGEGDKRTGEAALLHPGNPFERARKSDAAGCRSSASKVWAK